MSQTLEKRVEDLEKQVAVLSTELESVRTSKKIWQRTLGVFQNDKDFEAAVRLGGEYRKGQTYEREIAGS